MMDSPDILRRLDALENYDGKQAILVRLDMLELEVQQITGRLKELGLEIGQIAKIMMDASVPAKEMTDQEFATDLDRLLGEIFRGAESLPFDEALRRAAALSEKYRNALTR